MHSSVCRHLQIHPKTWMSLSWGRATLTDSALCTRRCGLRTSRPSICQKPRLPFSTFHGSASWWLVWHPERVVCCVLCASCVCGQRVMGGVCFLCISCASDVLGALCVCACACMHVFYACTTCACFISVHGCCWWVQCVSYAYCHVCAMRLGCHDLITMRHHHLPICRSVGCWDGISSQLKVGPCPCPCVHPSAQAPRGAMCWPYPCLTHLTHGPYLGTVRNGRP